MEKKLEKSEATKEETLLKIKRVRTNVKAGIARKMCVVKPNRCTSI